jgi:uncharacterized protein (DUF4213/DUF364 family)
MQIVRDILKTLPEGEVLDVRIGLHWIAVVMEVGGVQRCGLASTLSGGHHHDRVEADVPQAGHLETLGSRQLAEMALSCNLTQASIGIAAINALLPPCPQLWFEANAEDTIAEHGQGKRVVLVGRFPFTERLRQRVNELLVLEQNPGPGDLPASAAPEVLPKADVIAITGMTFANHTLEGLLALRPPHAKVIILGPSTPLSPVLFDYGVDILSGAVVTAIEPVLRTVSQGGDFRQVHRAGVRLVNIHRSNMNDH